MNVHFVVDIHIINVDDLDSAYARLRLQLERNAKDKGGIINWGTKDEFYIDEKYGNVDELYAVLDRAYPKIENDL